MDLIQPKGKQHQELNRIANEIRDLVEGSKLENTPPKESDQSGSVKKITQADELSSAHIENDGPDTVTNSTPSKPPIYPVKLRDNVIGQSRHKFSLRWKHFLLPGLIGFALGLICGGLLSIILRSPAKPNTGEEKTQIIPPTVIPNPPNTKEKTVYMVGSGTVFRYLIASNFFKRLEGVNKDVPVLEGPTETGVELFGSTNPMTNLPYTNPNIVLVMAAEKQSPGKLRQYLGQPGKIYEIYLGTDSLQVFYADGIERRDSPSDSDNFFSDKKRSTLTSADLRKNWGNGYDIYTGKPGSGTRNQWEGYLFGGAKPVWPREPQIWDIRMTQILHWPEGSKPRIYLGSQVLNEDQEKIIADSGRNIHRNPLTMVSENPDEVKRGLYLYGWIDTGDVHGNNEGYNLPKPVVDILKYVFDSLKDNTKYLEGNCLDEQRRYFHLKPYEDNGEGWVKIDPPPGQEFYRAETCKGRVEK